MKKIIFIFIIFIFLPLINAQPLKFVTNQSDYYFLTGENAVIPFNIENFKEVDGVISYSIVQTIQQQGFHYSNSNSQTQPFSIKENPFLMQFGTSEKPTKFSLDMQFTYQEKGKEIYITLPKINIIFVEKEEQKQNQENQQSSSSQTQDEKEKQEQEQQEKQKKAMEEQMKQQQEQNKLQNRMQNNQVGQDTNALKQQMQKEMQQNEELKKELAKKIQENPEFQKENQELQEQGYKPESVEINPENSTNGDFKINYKRDDSETASLSGKIEDNKVKNLKKESSVIEKEMQKTMENDERFKNYDNMLKKEGFERKATTIDKINDSLTNINVDYINKNNESARIIAEFNNSQLINVRVEKNSQFSFLYYLFAFAILASLGFLMIYKIYPKNKKSELAVPVKSHEIHFDYFAEARKLLEESKRLFKEEKFKDAYGKSSEAIRVYLSHKYGLKKEITNSELIRELKSQKIQYDKIQSCLNLCSMVEFAKYKANKEDFDEIMGLAKKIIE